MHDSITCSNVRLRSYGDSRTDGVELVHLVGQQGSPATLGLRAVEQLTESQYHAAHCSAC